MRRFRIEQDQTRSRAHAEREGLSTGGNSISTGTLADDVNVVGSTSPGRRQLRMFSGAWLMWRRGSAAFLPR
jgi:hypothetical protein